MVQNSTPTARVVHSATMNQRHLLNSGVAPSADTHLAQGEKYTMAVSTSMAKEPALNSHEKFCRITVLSCLLTARNAVSQRSWRSPPPARSRKVGQKTKGRNGYFISCASPDRLFLLPLQAIVRSGHCAALEVFARGYR